MYKYKRQIDNINILRKSSYILTDKIDTILCLNSDFTSTKPFNGMYIKNGKVIISNFIENVEYNNKIYKINNIANSNMLTSHDEYILNIDLEKSEIEYDNEDFYYSKKIYLEEKTGILAVNYSVKNKSSKECSFKVFPAITYRQLYEMKNSSMLKFSQRKEENGVVISLNVTAKEDVILKSDKASWNKENEYINDIKYNLRKNNDDIKEYIEDLLLPGYFEVLVNSNECKNFTIYVSSKNFNLTKIKFDDLSKKDFFTKQILNNSIENEYVELKELAYGIEKLNFKDKIISSIPYVNCVKLTDTFNLNNLDILVYNLTDIVKSVEGEFLCFNKIKEATKRILDINKFIEKIEKIDKIQYELRYKFCLLKLWTIESINKIIQKQNLSYMFSNIIEKIIYSIIQDEFFEEYSKNIEFVALMYNGLKIYENIVKDNNVINDEISIKQEYLLNKIKKEFWNEEKRILRKNLDEKEIYANVHMLYTISLSYSGITEDMQIKLLDTVFKELYTPYGLREYSKNSNKNLGLIYPKYMPFFVKANLNYNGITPASKKIAFNLVKELLLDINKYVNCGVKKIYSEKGYQIDEFEYDLLTNSEIIRLYYMLI